MDSNKVQQIIEQPFTDPYQPAHQNGPDYIIPTEECRTWLPQGATKIIFNKDTYDRKLESVITFFRRTVDDFPNHNALVVKRNKEWKKWTYSQYWDEVRIVAKGFIKLGLLPFHGVGILGFNAPEWLISHLATIFCGGFGAGIYTTNSPDACFHVLNDCDANIIVVENQIQLDKILKIRDSLPNLKAIVQYIGTPSHPDVFSWDDVIKIGKSVPDDILERRIKGLAINQCCTLIYTSGTTGNPKGVMISHDNIIFEIIYFLEEGIKPTRGDALSSVSYLPLSHIAALGTDLFASIYCANCVYFAGPDALKGSLVETLVDAKPVGFIGVPRVFEKIYERIKDKECTMNFIKRSIFMWARNQAAKYHALGKQKPTHKPIMFDLASKLVLEKIKKLLGLEKSRYLFCGGAPISKEVHQYFLELDLPIVEGYGLSESCGVHIMNDKNEIKIGTVGNVNQFPACEVKLHNQDENGCGEILLRGRNVCMGYLKLKDKTVETIDEDQWLYTGDLGTIDKDGSLRITGRIKELIITSGGENIPPLIIEDEITKNLPAVSNCMVIGDQRKYLTMLITLKTELDMDTLLPTDQLNCTSLRWCKDIGSSATTVSKIIEDNDDHVMSAIQNAIDDYNNEKAISNAQKIQNWIILPQDFSIPEGELGPTAKLKRSFISKKYSKEIDKMYSN